MSLLSKALTICSRIYCRLYSSHRFILADILRADLTSSNRIYCKRCNGFFNYPEDF